MKGRSIKAILMKDNESNGNDAAGTTLFVSLIRALESHGERDGVAVDGGASTSEETRQELEEWWRKAPFPTSSPMTKGEYERFYRQLIQVIHPHIKEITSKADTSAVEQWIEADWPHDQNAMESRELVQGSILRIVRCVSSFSSGATTLSLLRELRQACDSKSAVNEETAVVCDPSADEKKPRTMAEKLAQMRERRSTMIKDGSLANINKLTASTNKEADSATSMTTSSTTKVAVVKDDDAAHLFTIETRLELKEKLRGLQSRLDALLLETKLAWMKCFASEDHTEGCASGSDSAAKLVAHGEALASHLLDAFTMARSPKCPIGEYKTLVATCEAEMETFGELVSSIASAPSPVKSHRGKAKRHVHVVHVAEPTEESKHQPQPQPVEFDLPSMKAYYARAAPSYTAYLPKKNTNRR